jgi:DNA-binding CsgD family transcriptional regulator
VPALDVAAAVTLAAFMAAVSVVARVTQPDARPVTALGLALLVVCGLALALRRALPLPAFTLAVGAAVAYLGLRFAGWPVYLGAFAGLVALVSEVAQVRLWVPLATLGGIGLAVATGPPEGWDPARMITVALVWAVVAVLAAGDTLLAPQAARRLVAAFASTPAPKGPAAKALDLLTEREREVVALVGRGLSNDEIAERLVISPATARTHVSRAMVKLAARDRAQLVVFAYESGLVQPGRTS